MKCSVEICERPVQCKGLCRGHYQRVASGKPAGGPIAPRSRQKGVTCSVPECSRPCWSKGMCRFHDQRVRDGMSPEQVEILPHSYRSLLKTGWVSHGYRWIMDSRGREVMEHRSLMESHLGRTLHTDEIVHHIDGNKINNSLDNLVVMSREEHQSQHRIEQMYRKAGFDD